MSRPAPYTMHHHREQSIIWSPPAAEPPWAKAPGTLPPAYLVARSDPDAESVDGADSSFRKSKPFGLNPWLFAAMAAFVGMLLSGAVVGGVMGSMMAVKCAGAEEAGTCPSSQASSSSGDSSTTTTTRTYTPASPTTAPPTGTYDYSVSPARDVASLSVNCPSLNGITRTAPSGSQFAIECGLESQGAGASGGDITVIMALYAYSLDDCLDACASVNKRADKLKSTNLCKLVVFRTDMSSKIVEDGGGNCFLKNSARHAENAGTKNQNCVSGTLLAT